jgi:RNA polymerase sigma-70 factor (ECF subfamily)
LAFAFEAPRDSVPIITTASPANGRASQRGTRRGGLALTCAGLGLDIRSALINGAAGGVAFRNGRLFSIGGYTVRDGRIVEIDFLADPERLSRIELSILDNG